MTTTLQDNLETFRKRYPITKCLVEDNYIIYIFRSFYNASKAATEANMLIEKLKLPLVAIHSASNGYFVVQSNETEA